MKKTIFIVLCVLVLVGCGGPSRRRADKTKEAHAALARKVTLAPTNYGELLLNKPVEEIDAVTIGCGNGIEDGNWMSHFGSMLNSAIDDDEREEMLRRDKSESKRALAEYLTERVYPVKAGLKMVRDSRRFLLGEKLDSRLQGLSVKQMEDGAGLMFKTNF